MQADKEGVQSCDPSAVLLIRPQPAVNTLDLRTFVRKITLSRSMVAASDWICGITKLKVTVAADTKLFYVASIFRASVFCLNAEWDCLIGQNYGLSAVFCWIKTGCNSSSELGVVFLLGFNGFQALMGLLSLLSIFVVAAMFCRRALNHSTYLQHQHWKVLKEVLPLLIYPTLFSLVSIAGIVQTVYSVIEGGDHSFLGQLITFPVLMIALLLSFLLHPHIQSQLRCRIATNTEPSTVDTFTHHRTVPPTITTSQTCHIVSREYTEGDPLIVKQ